MGCDIHLYVEKKQNGKWVSCDKWERDDDSISVPYEERFYSGRNYNLFAILANVQNGRGFAGIKTGEGFVPIAEPKGVPEDANDQYKKMVEQWGRDGHSHSYFTVAELMAYDWTQVSCLQGWVNAETFEEFERWKKRNNDGPSDYCGDVFGGTTRHITNEEMRKLVKESTEGKYGNEFLQAIKTCAPHCYTLLEWTLPYYKCCQQFLSETLPRLWQLGKPEDVRIVFFFDN